MKILKMPLLFIIIMLLAPAVRADIQSVDYMVIIEDNGNSLVAVSIEGSGLIDIPIQEDVEEINADGALYLMENDSIEVSIGETGSAYILYATSALTGKAGDTWHFEMPLPDFQDLDVTVAMPEDTNLVRMEPNPVIESGEILQLHWKGSPGKIGVWYYFDKDTDTLPDTSREKNSPEIFVFAVPVLVLAAAGFMLYRSRKRKTLKLDKRQSIVRTLSPNEAKIVKTLMESGGEMRRSLMERKLDIAKSSLAVSLKNLERKNIVEVDRTSASHYVRFTEWFNEL